MALVVIRLIYVDFRVCRKKNAGDQMGRATAHFQLCVATLQWCSDRRGAVRTAGALARMTKRLWACQERPIATDLLRSSIAI